MEALKTTRIKKPAKRWFIKSFLGGSCAIRTHDHRIKSAVVYNRLVSKQYVTILENTLKANRI